MSTVSTHELGAIVWAGAVKVTWPAEEKTGAGVTGVPPTVMPVPVPVPVRKWFRTG